jgi:hypothetical protein
MNVVGGDFRRRTDEVLSCRAGWNEEMSSSNAGLPGSASHWMGKGNTVSHFREVDVRARLALLRHDESRRGGAECFWCSWTT